MRPAAPSLSQSDICSVNAGRRGRGALKGRGEGSCGGGGAPRDSAGSGATEEGLTSRGGTDLHWLPRAGVTAPALEFEASSLIGKKGRK